MRFALLASVLFAAPALAQTPATEPEEYEAARGAAYGQAQGYVWTIERTDQGDSESEAARIEVSLVADWVRWGSSDEPGTLIDLRTRRFITFHQGGADEVDEAPPVQAVNSSLYAEARRRIDIYAGLSRRGTLEQIQFGSAGSFHRIWLEAAMGVAAQSGALEISQDGGALIASHDTEVIARAWFSPGDQSPCLSAPAAAFAPMVTMLRHAAPLHPDLISAFHQLAVTPCALEFTVFSPESPQGRVERWTLSPSEESPAPVPSGAARAWPRAALIADVAGAAAEALAAANAPLDEAGFYDIMSALRSEGDLAGAFLTTVQETHNFGPCPEQAIGSARLVCGEVNALTQAGIGDADFERALEGVTAVRAGDHATAVGQLARFLDRQDRAGAAARILVANELVAWGQEGLESRPDLDPAALLAEAIILDPFAPDAYWHLGLRYLEAGAPHAAWAFFDLGRALPGRAPTPLLDQADVLEQRISALAPDLAPASASD